MSSVMRVLQQAATSTYAVSTGEALALQLFLQITGQETPKHLGLQKQMPCCQQTYATHTHSPAQFRKVRGLHAGMHPHPHPHPAANPKPVVQHTHSLAAQLRQVCHEEPVTTYRRRDGHRDHWAVTQHDAQVQLQAAIRHLH